MKKLLFMLVLLCIFMLHASEPTKYDLTQLKYNLTKEEVLELWGEPEIIWDEDTTTFVYCNNKETTFVSFFEDNKLYRVRRSIADEKTIEYLPEKHSYFDNSKNKGIYKISGYAAEQQLLKKGYEQKYLNCSQLMSESQLLDRAHKSYPRRRIKNYAFKEDRIVYEFLLFVNSTNEFDNYTVVAHIMNDNPVDLVAAKKTRVGFVEYDKNDDGLIEEEEGDYLNNQYYLEVDYNNIEIYKKKYIKFDINGDGKVEDDEGGFVYY